MTKLKFEKNWKQKTLEDLEKDNWGDPRADVGHLVYRTMELRRVPLDQFTTEDLRIMIGQGFGLFYLLPLAIETLRLDLFAEGNFYSGDLLNMALQIKHTFWTQHREYWKQLDAIIKDRVGELQEHKPTLSFDVFYSATYS